MRLVVALKQSAGRSIGNEREANDGWERTHRGSYIQGYPTWPWVIATSLALSNQFATLLT